MGTIDGPTVVDDGPWTAKAGDNAAGANLAATNLAAGNLAGANLAGANMGGTNLSGSNLAGSNLAGTNLGGNNLAGTNLAGSNLAGTNLAGNNLSGAVLSRMDLAAPSTGSNIHNLSGASGMLYSGEDRWMKDGTNRAQCIVMGIGSTAFAKLLGQQSPDARMSVALGKLPWGFATAAGGPTTLDAWEALVWGDKTYCTFVLVAVPGTTWTGVAGFIKAIFRWNAPPTQTVDISGIEASALIDPTVETGIFSYTGMMNAAAQWRAGLIPDKHFIAGEIGVAAATTNNQSVLVDFASWVLDSNLNPLILANVQAVAPPTYIESVYVVLDNGDGTVAVKLDTARPVWMSGNAKRTTPAGLIDSYNDMYNAYKAAPSQAKPKARRCGGALYYKFHFQTDVPAGKCDNGLTFYEQVCVEGYQLWSAISGTTAPMNAYMLTTLPGGKYRRSDNSRCRTLKPVLSETYVHMWEPSYSLTGN